MSECCGDAVLGNAQGDDQIQSHIKVITMSGEVIEICLPSTSTIKDVKCMLQTITFQPMYCSKLIWGADVLSNGAVLSDLPEQEHVKLSVTKVQHSAEARREIAGNGETWLAIFLRFGSSNLGSC